MVANDRKRIEAIEQIAEKENIDMKKVRGYFMHKHNQFNLFYSD